MKIYTTKEVSSILNVTPRSVRNWCVSSNVDKIKNVYQITDKHLNTWKDQTPTPGTTETRIQELEAIISDLRAQLKEYEVNDNELVEVSDNEVIEVFTKDEYKLFEQRLKEWETLQTELNHKTELFNIETKSQAELLEHYKAQFEYQKKQSERILLLHQKLIDTIELQAKNNIQRNTIEAKDKDLI